jgi:hypothetical protein
MDSLELWTLKEAAAALRMSENWLRMSDAPRLHLGKNLRFDPPELLAWARRIGKEGKAA